MYIFSITKSIEASSKYPIKIRKRLFTDILNGYKNYLTDILSGFKKYLTDILSGYMKYLTDLVSGYK